MRLSLTFFVVNFKKNKTSYKKICSVFAEEEHISAVEEVWLTFDLSQEIQQKLSFIELCKAILKTTTGETEFECL